MSNLKLTRFAKYAWGVLIYNLAVVLWGAYVRASGSGAGCGSHWPLCNGEILPRAPRVETLIEFAHRTSSGIAFLLVLILFIWAFRVYPKGHIVRKGASLSFLFIVTEALLGAGLVLFKLVADDVSAARAISISLHLVNTFLLLGFITLTAWWASGRGPLRLHGNGLIAGSLLLGICGMVILGMSGAVTALGDTLFPVQSLAEGLSQDVSPTAHFLVRLRLLHPTIAILVSGYLILVAGWINHKWQAQETRSLARALTILLMIQVGAGILNVFLLAPIWLQIVHLFLADAAWISLILLAASTLSQAQ